MVSKVLSAFPVFKGAGNGRFFYPKDGFGQIAESLYHEAKSAGAKFYLNAKLISLRRNGKRIRSVCSNQDGKPTEHFAEYVWSTIPITTLVQSFRPEPPASVLLATHNIQFRAMILVYLVLEQGRFSEYDAHYFPSLDIPITRLSEPKNYSNAREPRARTVLCAELPCYSTDPEWSMTDCELGELICNCLEKTGILLKSPPRKIITRRLKQAYPILKRGHERYLDQLHGWLGQFDNLISFGRQGLFQHDNVHHALYTGYCAAACLSENGILDREKWQACKSIFQNFVVED
jgi:protoporphyrinogen oxidase